MESGPGTRTLGAVLSAAAGRIDRLDPSVAWAEVADGAVLVDVRSEVSRARDGVVPGGLHLPLTVFPWRLAPDSSARHPAAPELDQRVIVLCDHGFSSVLAAALLADIGYARPADVIGGFEAWSAAGLPTGPGPPPDAPPTAGLGPPDAV